MPGFFYFMVPTIRQIKRDDIGTVVSLLREFAAYENLSEYCTATEERFAIALFGEGAVVYGLIAFDEDLPVGFALFYPNFSSFRGQQGLHLEDIFVKSEYRGHGIGEAMLREIARLAVERGCERIDFRVLDWNRTAIDFYKKLGAESNAEETHFKFSDDAFRALAS